MAATTKKKKFVRKDKNKKKYSWVSFETDIFEGEFILPDLKHLSLRAVDALNSGKVSILVQWMKAAEVDQDMVDAVLDLEQGEMEDFTKAWGEGSLVTLPKSSD